MSLIIPNAAEQQKQANNGAMKVLKRSGKHEDVSFDKITARIRKLCYGIN